MCAHGFQEGSSHSLLQLLARKCLISKHSHFLDMKWVLFLQNMLRNVCKGNFRDVLCFFTFFLWKEISRACCAGNRCCSANSDTRHPFGNRQVLQTFRRQGGSLTHPSGRINISLSTGQHALISGNLHFSKGYALGRLLQKTMKFFRVLGRAFLLFCSIIFCVCFLATLL